MIDHTLPFAVYNLYGPDIGDLKLFLSIINTKDIRSFNYSTMTNDTIDIIKHSVRIQKTLLLPTRPCIYSNHKMMNDFDIVTQPIHYPLTLFNHKTLTMTHHDIQIVKKYITSLNALRVWMKLHMIKHLLLKDVVVYITKMML